jgi:hypothetical protein
VWLSVRSLPSLNNGKCLDERLMNTLPTLWHRDHVVRLHTGFYDQIKDGESWEISKRRILEVARNDRIWILHVQDGPGWLSVFMDWKWMRLSCYNPLRSWDAHQRRSRVLKVSRRF